MNLTIRLLLIIFTSIFFSCNRYYYNSIREKEIAKDEIEGGFYTIYTDQKNCIYGELHFNDTCFKKAVRERLNLELRYKDTCVNNFNINCFKNAVDSILKIKYGLNYYNNLLLKTDSLVIDEEAKKVNDGIYYLVHKRPVYINDSLTIIYKDSIGKEIQKRHKKPINARVICSFIIDSIGNLQSPKVLRGIDSLIDNECIIELNKMPRWIPGELYGKKVNVRTILPIIIK